VCPWSLLGHISVSMVIVGYTMCHLDDLYEIAYHYLDDFAVLGALESEQCGHNLGLLKMVCSELGIPLAPEKQVVFKFLGG